MCGVIGIISERDVTRDLFIGLLGLQHRGQDSAGILTFDNNFKIKKDKGYVEDVFSERDLDNLKANIGIGHTRYPTVGSDFRTDAQPFYVAFPNKVGIVHNGQVTNYYELRRRFFKKNRALTSTCDIEAVLNVFAEALLGKKGLSPKELFEAVKKVFKRAKGAYSVVMLIGGKGLLAFRDPNAIRPLVMMNKKFDGEKAYAFVSESTALINYGYVVERNIAPGEAVFIDNNLRVHSKKIVKGKPHHCMFEWVYFSRTESILEGKEVYKVRLELGRQLAKEWRKTGLKADVVFPVPDTSRTAATTMAEELKLPCREGLIKNRYIGRTFIMASQTRREDSVKLKLNPIPSEVKGKRILLVDDSIVRGTTSKKIVKLLKEYGAKAVYFISTCPPIRFPCFYGIDMPVKSELIASDKTIKEIREFIEADYLIYNSIPGLRKAIGLKGLCMACLDGRYPSKVPKETIEEFGKERTEERKRV
ncbi:MAG: amidophosphoribosyltransferase [archaeon]